MARPDVVETEVIETELVVEATTIEGEVIDDAPDDTPVATFTLEHAASDYFQTNAKKIDHQHRVAVTRFISWVGGHRVMTTISAHEMSLYQEAQGANVAHLAERLLPVKAFLAFSKKREWIPTNLGVHLRVKKPKVLASDIEAAPGEDIVEMTAEGLELAKRDLARLHTERPLIAKKLEEAMADKDFRENAPLDAARDEQALLEARIRDLEHQVNHARVRNLGPDGRAHLGSTVTATNLESSKGVEYTLVGQNEVDAAAGRISVASPVGQAFVGGSAGDEVQVETPSGSLSFRIEKVTG
jgi:transcription elongation factor GreA